MMATYFNLFCSNPASAVGLGFEFLSIDVLVPEVNMAMYAHVRRQGLWYAAVEP